MKRVLLLALAMTFGLGLMQGEVFAKSNKRTDSYRTSAVEGPAGTYTMTAAEAARAVNTIKPETAIPIHYGDIVGTEDDAKRFKDLCEVSVAIKHA